MQICKFFYDYVIGGAWPLLVRGVICLLNCALQIVINLLTIPVSMVNCIVNCFALNINDN